MLKPSEIVPVSTRIHRTTYLYEQFDAAIRDAEENCTWPAIVRTRRDGATQAEINAVIIEYRAAGWLVDAGVRDGTRATIDHPDRQR